MTSTVSWDSGDAATANAVTHLGGPDALAAAIGKVLVGRSVALRSLTPGISGAAVFRTSSRRLDGTRAADAEGVLKLGPARLLATEVANYDEFVKFKLEPGHFAPLEYDPGLTAAGSADPESLWAIYYRDAGAEDLGQVLRRLLAQDRLAEACDYIDRLLEIIRPWQETVAVETDKSLTSDGVYSFRVSPFDDFEATCRSINEQVTSEDRVDVKAATKVRDIWAPAALNEERILFTQLHGDLHPENVMVNSRGQLMLIDFGACGNGHFLRDLSTFEAHLVLRALAPAGSDVSAAHSAYLAALQRLYTPEFLFDPWSAEALTGAEVLVARLRRYAHSALMNGRREYASHYALSLLRHAIRVATRPAETGTVAERWLALSLSVALRQSLSLTHRSLHVDGQRELSRDGSLRFLDYPEGRWYERWSFPVPRSRECTPQTWAGIATDILAARQADFLGVVPTPLVDALHRRAKPNGPSINYITVPHPGIYHSGVGYVSPRWKISLIGMRNLANMLSSSPTPIDRFAASSDDVAPNCVVRLTRTDGSTSILEISRVTETPVREAGIYHVTEVSDPTGTLSEWITVVRDRAKDILIREVDCHLVDLSDSDRPVPLDVFEVAGLRTYGDPTIHNVLRPIVLTILRESGPLGLRVVMKQRSPLADNDDYGSGKYSFLSTRLLVEDLCRSRGVTITSSGDAEQEFGNVWEAIGGGRFELTDNDFRAAAQRDLHGTTLIDLTDRPDRFAFHGVHVLTRPETRTQLGFAVMTVDLTRDESSLVRAAHKVIYEGIGPELQLLPVARLFDGSILVNKFTQERGEWLRENVLC